MARIRIVAAIGLAFLAACLAGPPEARSQSRQSVWDGVYTDAQADRGRGQYGQHCAVCHGADLEGNGESPPLVGQFIPDWAGTTLAELDDKIQNTMPLNAPGTLRPAIAVDILAYLLKANNFPSGQNELEATTNALGRIAFEVKSNPAASHGNKR